MANVLLDTHAMLWLLNGDQNIPQNIQFLLDDPATEKYVSDVSFWEIAIKVSVGKLKVRHPLPDLPNFFTRAGFRVLPVTTNHVLSVASLPFHHKDPFDRLLISQALLENLTLLTKDPNIFKYNVPTLW